MPDNSQDPLKRPQLLPVSNATLSYWRTEPHRIDEYRSTEQLPAECDIAIIGSGMAGVATAYHLAKLSGTPMPSMVMLEARQVCSGATGRNGGHVKIGTGSVQNLIKRHGIDAAEEISTFVTEQIYAIKDTVETENIDCEFELRRSFDVYLDNDEAKEAETLFKTSLGEKQTWTRNVDFVEERCAEQVTSLKNAKAALSTSACSLWPYKFVTGLLQRLVDDKAVQLHTWTPVTRVETDKDADGAVLHTPRGIMKARKVIFAANAYTGGICDLYAGKIVPYKGTACHITPFPSTVSPHLSHTYNISYKHRDQDRRVDYLNPRPDGGIVVGGGKWKYAETRDAWYNNWDDSTLLPGVDTHFDGLMQRYFAGWANSGAVVDHLWTGIMGGTKDELPHIGEIPGLEGHQYIIAGFNGGGMAMIFLSARGLAQMVLGQTSYEETGLPRLYKTSSKRL